MKGEARTNFIQKLDNRLNIVIDNFEHWTVKDVRAELADIRHKLWKLEK